MARSASATPAIPSPSATMLTPSAQIAAARAPCSLSPSKGRDRRSHYAPGTCRSDRGKLNLDTVFAVVHQQASLCTKFSDPVFTAVHELLLLNLKALTDSSDCHRGICVKGRERCAPDLF